MKKNLNFILKNCFETSSDWFCGGVFGPLDKSRSIFFLNQWCKTVTDQKQTNIQMDPCNAIKNTKAQRQPSPDKNCRSLSPCTLKKPVQQPCSGLQNQVVPAEGQLGSWLIKSNQQLHPSAAQSLEAYKHC